MMGVNKKLRLGANQQKALLLLKSGLVLAISSSPIHQWHILRETAKEWGAINRRALRYAIQQLYHSRLLREQQNTDGSITLVLTEMGKERALRFSLDSMQIHTPARWDGKWRLILFDIPERFKKLRDTFREHLRRLGFYEFQKSVFIHPYDCKDELDFLIEFYNARKYVRSIIAEWLDNELHLRSHFKLRK